VEVDFDGSISFEDGYGEGIVSDAAFNDVVADGVEDVDSYGGVFDEGVWEVEGVGEDVEGQVCVGGKGFESGDVDGSCSDGYVVEVGEGVMSAFNEGVSFVVDDAYIGADGLVDVEVVV